MRKLIDEFWYYSAVVFSRINPFLIRHFHVDKLGFFLRHLSQSRIIQVQGFSFHMDANISSCYPKLIGGKFNEEETHKFLQKVLQQFDSIDLFLDVGSNIGEFVVTVGASHKTRRVIGFEPNPLCVSSCLKSVRLNGLKNVTIIQKILTDSHEAVEFDVSGQNAHLHSVFDGAGGGSQTMYSSTLDDEVQVVNSLAILKVDVEGAELLVLRGAKRFILNNLPLIVFEFNNLSKRHFSLEDIRATLPEGYDIFRVRPEDGFLDTDFSETWNCAAVHRDSAFYKIIRNLVK